MYVFASKSPQNQKMLKFVEASVLLRARDQSQMMHAATAIGSRSLACKQYGHVHDNPESPTAYVCTGRHLFDSCRSLLQRYRDRPVDILHYQAQL